MRCFNSMRYARSAGGMAEKRVRKNQTTGKNGEGGRSLTLELGEEMSFQAFPERLSGGGGFQVSWQRVPQLWRSRLEGASSGLLLLGVVMVAWNAQPRLRCRAKGTDWFVCRNQFREILGRLSID